MALGTQNTTLQADNSLVDSQIRRGKIRVRTRIVWAIGLVSEQMWWFLVGYVAGATIMSVVLFVLLGIREQKIKAKRYRQTYERENDD